MTVDVGGLTIDVGELIDDVKVVNLKEVREVQEGATCFCDIKLSKLG